MSAPYYLEDVTDDRLDYLWERRPDLRKEIEIEWNRRGFEDEVAWNNYRRDSRGIQW